MFGHNRSDKEMLVIPAGNAGNQIPAMLDIDIWLTYGYVTSQSALSKAVSQQV